MEKPVLIYFNRVLLPVFPSQKTQISPPYAKKNVIFHFLCWSKKVTFIFFILSATSYKYILSFYHVRNKPSYSIFFCCFVHRILPISQNIFFYKKNYF